jgi:arginyl-tRNA synthetase
MNFFQSTKKHVAQIVKNLGENDVLPKDLDCSKITVEPPRDASHGDMASNVAMVLCKQAKMPPRDLATKIAKELNELDDIESVEIAGPGFINMRLSNSFWYNRLKTVLVEGREHGSSDLGKGKKINIEFVSANPTGPMHVGHSRGAIFGDALASLLQKAGYDVTREYYVNDAGAQIDVLARSLFLRYKEALGEDIGEIPEGLYPGDYLIPPAKKMAEKEGDKWVGETEENWLPMFRSFAVSEMLDMIRDDLAALGIKFDVFFSERSLVEAGGVEDAIKNLEGKGLIYKGVLEPPKGKKTQEWEAREQLLFRSTEFGDDVDRPLKKADGSQTYFASDIAYHLDKFERGFETMINVWGADHGGYVKRLDSAIKAITGGKGNMQVKLCQMVNLMDNGEPLKMSKRAGNFVTLRDMIDSVGKGVARFIMLTRKNDAQLDFDFTKVKEQSKDNPVFYVQYAHARCCSVIRHAQEMFKNAKLDSKSLADVDFSLLTDESELAIIKLMAEFTRTVEIAAEAQEPHRIAYYLYDLAAAFHGLWNKGRDDASMRFLEEEKPELSIARVALLTAISTVIAAGLEIFGVEPAEEM